ncbi:uncharacterized protein LAESUDRAFT_415420 [Laetiporus sulphureus 93-53]|uniref:Uncharacterized protein n=1 Tax=Laetiporus sulphureus 93-53 TaxID=1314785 RepID=A0A165C8P3_9APHY|nr:uncharacterized protein LAESUDRAFT_415420 [Laetiporus sulphureus 93-53]KZT02395.1 hypothetical protein LAESUDRAFT_415420 [Laetiporus sulphureus 93-53]
MMFAHTRTSRVKNEQFWVLRWFFEVQKRPIAGQTHGEPQFYASSHFDIWQTRRYAEDISPSCSRDFGCLYLDARFF